MLYEFEVRIYNVASSFFYEEMFPKNREKTTKPRINYNFFSQEIRRIEFQSPWQRPVKCQVTRPYRHLHNICIIATKQVFNESYWVFRSTHIIHEIGKILSIKTAIRRVFSLFWRTSFYKVNRFEHVRRFMYDRLPQFFASNFELTIQITFVITWNTFRIVVLVKNCPQELCKIVQSSFDSVRHIVGILCRKLLKLKNTSCRPHSSISAQTLYVISIIYRIPVLQIWQRSEVKWFFAQFFLSSVTGDRYWPLSSGKGSSLIIWQGL